jgi:hypothetical protein
MAKNTFPVNGGAMPNNGRRAESNSHSKLHFGDRPMITDRRSFIGGSDARPVGLFKRHWHIGIYFDRLLRFASRSPAPPPFSGMNTITGGGKWVEITVHGDPLYQHLLLTAEKKFWRCVESGELPHLFGIEPPKPRLQAVRIVDMSSSNAWAEFASLYRVTRPAALDHDRAKTELKALVPEDAKEASGHGVRARRSKSGAISFDVFEVEAGHAAL